MGWCASHGLDGGRGMVALKQRHARAFPLQVIPLTRSFTLGTQAKFMEPRFYVHQGHGRAFVFQVFSSDLDYERGIRGFYMHQRHGYASDDVELENFLIIFIKLLSRFSPLMFLSLSTQSIVLVIELCDFPLLSFLISTTIHMVLQKTKDTTMH